MSISRKGFVAATAAGISAAALEPRPASAADGAAPHFHIVMPGEYDRARMLATIETKNDNKQVFQSVTPILAAGTASLYLHIQNSLNAYEFSYGLGPGSLATLAVLTGGSVAYALGDEVWRKYGLGTGLKLAPANVYYRAASLRETGSPDDPDSVYQDWSAQAVLHRGGAFMVCHNALTNLAAAFAPKAGVTPAQALDDFVRNVLPGFQIVPAGVAATQLALEHGWHPYPLI